MNNESISESKTVYNHASLVSLVLKTQKVLGTLLLNLILLSQKQLALLFQHLQQILALLAVVPNQHCQDWILAHLWVFAKVGL